jgi:hypothetical protein
LNCGMKLAIASDTSEMGTVIPRPLLQAA